MTTDAATDAKPPTAGCILVVDDEAAIRSSLRRLLHRQGYEVILAASAAEGLRQLEEASIDVVLSDMRMPGMDGAQFLEQVVARWPDVGRILLTAFADTDSAIAAVNRGRIWRYVTKPWNDEDLMAAIDQAMKHRRLVLENARLQLLTNEQNVALRQLNAELESRVEERTAQLQQAMGSLRQTFLSTVNVFSAIMDLHGGHLAGHSRRVADHARHLATRLGLDDNAAQDVFLAALLHDIGKIGMGGQAMERPFNALSAETRGEVIKHPARGEMLLMPIQQLAGAALLVRHHHEQFDGRGYPDGISGLSIPLGARILAVANDYDALQIGTLVTGRLSPADALRYLVANRGARYDPTVVDAFGELLAESQPSQFSELVCRPTSLKPGMRLTRDLMHRDGYLLLAKDHVLTALEITNLGRLEASESQPLTVHVLREVA